MKYLFLSVFSFFYFLPIDLEKRVIMNNKIEILIPKDFKEMDAEMLELKYKGENRPTLVFTNEDGTVNIAFNNHVSVDIDDSDMEEFSSSMEETFQTNFPNATWKGVGVKVINGRKVGCLKLITDAIDQKIYNSIFITHCQGTLLIGTFNCAEKLMGTWEETSEKIIESLVIK